MKTKVEVLHNLKSSEYIIATKTIIASHQYLQNKLKIYTNLFIFNDKKIAKGFSGTYNNKFNSIAINLYNLKGSNIEYCINVLSHEMRHAYQWEKKWFSITNFSDFNEGKGIWKGKKYNNGYWNSPWEKDARLYGQKWGKEIIDSLSLHKISKIKV